eukprot:scaffold281538_cov36-Tisochrysis_lutea.AAC.3
MSLIVQDIYLLRTLFLTSNGVWAPSYYRPATWHSGRARCPPNRPTPLALAGESMMLSNSVIKNMQLTNYARSGKITLLVQLTVPIATSSAKVTELLDAISDFVRSAASHVPLTVQLHCAENRHYASSSRG